MYARDVVKRCRRDPKIGMESRFGSNSMMEFEAKIPLKILPALLSNRLFPSIGEKVNRLVLVTKPDAHFRSAGVDVASGDEGIGDQYEMI